MRLVFCGTPDFAVPHLEAVHAAGHEIPLVLSQPDRPRGRGQKLSPTPVRAAARRLGLPDLTLERGRAAREAMYERVLGLDPEVVVVVAFGHIVRQPLLDGPAHGCVNVHASLLPRWRGPAPIHRAILAGDDETGVSTMRLEAGVDTGPWYEQARTSIGPDDTTPQLHDRLAAMGAGLLVSTLAGLAAGELRATPQPEAGATHAPLLKREEGSTRLDRPARVVHDRVRALQPWPGVAVMLDDLRLKLVEATVEDDAGVEAAPGTILGLEGDELRVACAPGVLRVRRLQPPGKPPMTPRAFAQGHPLPGGATLRPVPGFVEWSP